MTPKAAERERRKRERINARIGRVRTQRHVTRDPYTGERVWCRCPDPLMHVSRRPL